MTAVRPLPRVDATKPRGRAYRAYARLTATRPATWISRHVGWRLDPYLLRLTGGRVGFGLWLPTAVLETTGARSGLSRRNAVIYFHDGDSVILIASKAGAPEHPGWYHNAIADHDVVFGGHPYAAHVVDDEAERARIWNLADNVFPPFATYRLRADKVGRTIPILRLCPR
jgi:deazaflavin-dependent oxidoreductase (nitroreductase family)